MSPIHSDSLVVVDNTDPDNLACALAASNPRSKQRLLGVIVTGRSANFNSDAALGDVNERDSQFTLRLNAVRMRNFLDIAGRNHIPVFMGSIAPHTIVPHRVHINEIDFGGVSDVQLDIIERLGNPAELGLAGGLDVAVGYLMAQKNPFHVIVGGPMTDLAKIVRAYPSLAPKIIFIHAQFGMFGFGEKALMDFGETPRGKRQFNVACDPEAAHYILMNFPCPIYLYPSDVTRVDSVGFSNPDELASRLQNTAASRELMRIYRIAYERMIKPRNEKIYIHDLAPLFGYLDMFPYAQDEIDDRGACIATDWAYKMKAVEIVSVPFRPEEKEHWGEIQIQEISNLSVPIRIYVATAVSSKWYLREMYGLVV